MVIPLHDDNPTNTRPYVTVGIMISCVLVYVWQHLLLSDAGAREAVYAFGAIPAVLTGEKYLPEGIAVIPPWASLLTSMFMHGGFWHLAGNMLYLWIFGNNLEDAMGHVRFLLFYVLCGIAAVYAFVLPHPMSEMPMVGASGAISGVLGGYLLLFPRARVLLGLPIGFIVIGIGRFPAIWVLAAWFLMQLLLGGLSAIQSTNQSQGGIAFGAHIGGFIAGLLLVAFLKRRHVPLWRRY